MTNQPLLDQTIITEYLTREAAWAESHGASADYLGMGLLYYTLAYVFKARVAVCLGSGGGFVPRLMRQAQRDLGMATTSRTILVDGNVPEAGWGSPQWLAPDSLFRTQYPDVEIILDLTRDAADAWSSTPEDKIDYLHIDADHSFEGCYADFIAFLPYLHEGSIVTFHDTHYAGAGVGQVVEHIRTLAGCEVIDFPDVGEGTSVVRIVKPAGQERFRPLPQSDASEESLIQVTRNQEMSPIPPPEKEWKYLESASFATRYVLAAHFVRACRTVIEIGGAKTPIDKFLDSDHDSVLVIDPLISESHQKTLQGQPCRVSHIRARFQDLTWTIPPHADFGLVMLGLEFQGLGYEHWQTLYQLIEHAKITVIEFPMSWEPSRAQFQAICNNTCTRIIFRARLDLDGNDFGNLEHSWPPRTDRTIFVLGPRSPEDGAWLSQPAFSHSKLEGTASLPGRQLVGPASAGSSGQEAALESKLLSAWQGALTSRAPDRFRWSTTGGHWQWQDDSVVATADGVEWSSLEWAPWNEMRVDGTGNFLLEVTVNGTAEAAGLSFGAYKDFLAPLNSSGSHRLQLEVDASTKRWAFRIDGQLQNRFWWDSAVHSVDDLLSGVFTFKARNAREVRFYDLSLHWFASSCRLSVIICCNRFAQRLRLSLRNWCHSLLPQGALEILVVNPQSPDGTHEHLAAVAASFPHLRVRELAVPASMAKNKGMMINRAIDASLGEWIWLSDADCLFAPESAAFALQQAGKDQGVLFYGQRCHLSESLTDALLAGRFDSLADFPYLASAAGPRPADNSPWGYTQLAHRSVFTRVRYSERVNHFAKSDDLFVEECRRRGFAVRQIPDLFCLHLNHPFAWYGTGSFL